MEGSTRKTLVRTGAGVAFFFALIWLVQAITPVSTIVLVSFFLAYILDPLVKKVTSWGVRRSFASLCILAAGGALFTVFIIFLIPSMFRELAGFALLLPKYLVILQQKFLEVALKWDLPVPHDWEQVWSWVIQRGRQIVPSVADTGAKMFSSLFSSTIQVMSALFYMMLIPVITFYLLDVFESVKNGIYELLPAYTRDPLVEKLRTIDAMLAAFVRGQLTVCLTLAFLYSVGFLLVGIDLAIFLGITAGLLFIIPYLGTMVGLIFGSLMALAKFGDWWHPAYIVGWIMVVQLFEGYVLTPKVVGEAIGLPPVVYILAVMIGGNLFGFVGMLTAIPVTAVLKVIMSSLIDMYRESYLYTDDAVSRLPVDGSE